MYEIGGFVEAKKNHWIHGYVDLSITTACAYERK